MGNLHGVLRGNTWIMFHNLLVIALGSPKSWWFNAALPLALLNITLQSWPGPKQEHMLWSLNMVHFHFTLNLRAHQLRQWISISRGPLEFHGHGAWYVCKTTPWFTSADRMRQFLVLSDSQNSLWS